MTTYEDRLRIHLEARLMTLRQVSRFVDGTEVRTRIDEIEETLETMEEL